MRMSRHIFLLMTLALLGFLSSELQAELSATANLRPAEISLGEAAQLEVTIKGATAAERPLIAKVDGLDIQPVGSQNFQNVQIVNGRMTVDAGITHVYRVTPSKTGTFTIPGISVIIDSETRVTQPVTLTVLDSPAGQFAPARPSIPTRQGTTPQTNIPGKAAMVTLTFPERDYYSGETIPLTIKAYFNPNVRVLELNPPTFEGEAFTLPNLNFQPIQKQENVEGVEYNVLEWKTSISAVKDGSFPISSQIRGILGIPSARTPRPAGSMDDFFDNFFNRSFNQQEINLASEEKTIRVLPLPSEGKPANFSGAIGSFKMESTASPTTLAEGDPLTVKSVIFGTGNFSQVDAPTLSQDKHFRTYTPSSKFEPSGDSEFTGRKTFEQIMIPMDASVRELPPLVFSYFDPEKKTYVTLKSPAVPLQVEVSQGGSLTAGTGIQGVRGSDSGPPRQDLVDNKSRLGAQSSTLTPLTQNALFWAAQGIPLAAWVICTGLYVRRRRIENDAGLNRVKSLQKSLDESLSSMDHACEKSDAHTFFHHARRAMQTAADLRGWDVTATLENDAPDASDAQFARLFEELEHIAYSGVTPDRKELEQWKSRVHDQIQNSRRHS
ncbi:BatD family protein [Kamptonema cortianum]|nr:BatD family protein [Kamptonema cortianum]